MPRFSEFSRERLVTAHPDLQRLFQRVVLARDCRILEGHRDADTQERYVLKGTSRLSFPLSKHNALPALALDVVPYFDDPPHVRWADGRSFGQLALFVKGVAHGMGIDVIWGGDWKRFVDMPHWELAGRWDGEVFTPAGDEAA